MKWYAVQRRKVPGVYNSWSKCEEQVNVYNNNKFKQFKTRVEAEEYYLESIRQTERSNHEVGNNAA
jgi:ribonuclease HI